MAVFLVIAEHASFVDALFVVESEEMWRLILLLSL